MIPKELDDLIKEYLTDGIISEQERKVLLRKAEKMGLDLDEIDLYITAQEQKVEKKETAEEEKKFGKTCPNCGKQVKYMTLKCTCGYEFKDTKATSSVQDFFDKLNNIQLTEQEMATCKRSDGKSYWDDAIEKIKKEKKTTMISTFPVPNTKEDIIEFLAMAAPNSKMKGGKYWGTTGGRVMVVGIICIIGAFVGFILGAFSDEEYGAFAGIFFGLMIPAILSFYVFGIGGVGKSVLEWNKMATAWRNKFDQVLMKGRSLRGDAEFQQQLDYYENMINQK